MRLLMGGLWWILSSETTKKSFFLTYLNQVGLLLHLGIVVDKGGRGKLMVFKPILLEPSGSSIAA